MERNNRKESDRRQCREKKPSFPVSPDKVIVNVRGERYRRNAEEESMVVGERPFFNEIAYCEEEQRDEDHGAYPSQQFMIKRHGDMLHGEPEKTHGRF